MHELLIASANYSLGKKGKNLGPNLILLQKLPFGNDSSHRHAINKLINLSICILIFDI